MAGRTNLAKTVLSAFNGARLTCSGTQNGSGLLHHCSHPDQRETAFEMICPPIRFGPGVTKEIGQSITDMRCSKALIITDCNLRNKTAFTQVADSLTKEKIPFDIFDERAIDAARAQNYDVFIAVGGGSAIDTAKCAAIFHANPQSSLWDFTTVPFGKGLNPPNAMTPLIAVPTTAGTGSETTAVSVFDVDGKGLKTAIRNRKIKPNLALVDPLNVAELPRNVAIFSGFDVLCHALESYTAKPFNERDASPGGPANRPLYQGSNPISDVWAQQALRIIHAYFKRAVDDHGDLEAKTHMLLASSYAGMGFGNAGVHLCHGLSYPISGLGKNYTSPDYPQDKPLIPHGLSVVLTAPSVFEFTGPACPDRHRRAAALLSGDEMGTSVENFNDSDCGGIVADRVKEFMSHFAVPNGLSQGLGLPPDGSTNDKTPDIKHPWTFTVVGFNSSDTETLAKNGVNSLSALQLSPRPAVYEALHEIYANSLSVY